MQALLELFFSGLPVYIVHLLGVRVQVVHLPLVYGFGRVLFGTRIKVNKLISICCADTIMTPYAVLCGIFVIMIVKALTPILGMFALEQR